MGKFVIKKAKTGIMFNLHAGNGEIIATSEVYKTKAAAKNGIASIIKNSGSDVEDQTKDGYEKLSCPKYEIYKDKKGEFRFRLKARNGQIIAVGESYKDQAGVKNGVSSIKKNATPDTKIIDETLE
ncbi:MAG: DUF1508 domain-containing protein [Treponema sp.]|nr:DUF1508 domain-containing protein [Treponema sp.]MBQ2552243.1 DUF1508 domain-containing protein [Treponema sp.]MBQ4235760.1 DUF1508 domain-containing protein [Treponema sp.]MBQ5385178.1 DUF1508 domain-containing protein [Treponema sp.]